MRHGIAILVFLAIILSVSFATDLTDCWTAISPGGYYRLTKDVSNPDFLDRCFEIRSSNVELDCNGHSITNNDTRPQTTYGIYLSGHYTNVTIRNCVIKNYGYGGYNGYGVFLDGWDDPDSFMVVNNTAINNSYRAFDFEEDSNCTIVNNTAYGNSSSANGFFMSYSSGNALINNTAYSISGIGLSDCNNNRLINNRAYNGSVGIGIYGSSYNNTLAGNSVVNASYMDIEIYQADNITLSDNVIIGGSEYGYMFMYGSGANLTNNTAINISGSGWSGFEFLNYSNNVVVGNKAYNASESFVFTDSSNNSVANNTASDGWARGFEFTQAYGENNTNTNNTIINNTASGKGIGFLIETYNSTIANNTAASSTWGGIDVYYDNNAVIGNTAFNNSGTDGGMYVSGNNLTIAGNNASNSYVGIGFYGSGITFANNTASGNSFIGIYFNADNILADNNTASNSGVDGFRYGGGSNLTFTNSVASGNGHYGFNMGANFTASGIHLFDNGLADILLGGPGDVSLSGIIMDNPAGNFTDYTNLSLYDSMGSESYSLSWSGQPGSLWPGARSFESKYLSFSTSSGSPLIDSMTWQWNEDEVSGGGYNESALGLYAHPAPGPWPALNTTPDTTAHTLGLSDFAPDGVVGILEYVPPGPCPAPIVSSGYHSLNRSASGAPNSASGYNTCVDIAASNVVFDCNGYGITSNGTSNSVGIYVASSATHVTIQNCLISDYYIGVLTSNYTNVTNVVVENSTGFLSAGIQLGGPYNVIANNTVGGASSYGIATAGFPLYGNQSFGNTIANNTVSDSETCIYLIIGSNDNLVSGNTVHDCTSYGIFDQVGARNTIIGNIMHNSWHGLMILGSEVVSNSTIANNIAYDNEWSSIWFDRGVGYNVTNNTLRNSSQEGIFLISDDYGDLRDNNFINNTVYDNPGTVYAFYIQTQYASSGYYAFDNNFTGNVVHDSYNGFYFGTSYGNILANNTVYANSNRGLYLYNSSASVSGDHYYNNNWDFRAEAASAYINLSSVVFDNPAGDFTNYTNLSLSDTVNDGESYSLRWSDQPGSLRPGARSFESKYLAFSTDFGSPSIDSMTWSWQESEVIAGGYNESILGLYRYTGSWSARNTSPDTFAHTLGLSGFAPDGVVGILEYLPPPPTCPLPIGTPGYHELNQTASGAPNDASDFYTGAMACVKITSSDVVFDCNGFNITNDGSGDSVGIFVDGESGPLTNVTIRNCPGISEYNFGIYSYGTSGSNFTNLYAFDNGEGLELDSSAENNIIYNDFEGNGYGVYLYGSTMNNITYNAFSGNYEGVYLGSTSNGNIIIHNNMTGNEYGFYVDTSDNNQIGYNNIFSTYSSNRLSGFSCPMLYTYNGTGYEFQQDIGVSGGLGKKLDGALWEQHPFYTNPALTHLWFEDYAKIPSNDLVPVNGTYSINVKEEFQEVDYIDKVALMEIDHDSNTSVYPDIRKNGVLYTVDKNAAPAYSVSDNYGDVSAELSQDDGVFWSSYYNTSPSYLDIKLLEQNNTPSNLKLVFSMVRTNPQEAYGANITQLSSKRAEAQFLNQSGQWQALPADRQISTLVYDNASYDMTTNYYGESHSVFNLSGLDITDNRIRLVIYDNSKIWHIDQLLVDTSAPRPYNVTTLLPESADLHFKGASELQKMDPSDPYSAQTALYDNIADPNGVDYQLGGNATKYGDVNPLLSGVDDEYVIMTRGDELGLGFNVTPMQGAERDFILYMYVYYKQSSKPLGHTIGPLPFQNMSGYPYNTSIENYPTDHEHKTYLSTWNTRQYNSTDTHTVGISLPNSLNNTVFNNNITGDSGSIGLDLYEEEGSTIRDNSISGVRYGLYIDTSLGVNASNNNISDCGDRGIYIYNSDQTYLANNYLRNDSNGFVVRENAGSTVTYNATGLIFDNPAGGFSGYTNLSLFGTVNNGEGYSLGWTDQPASLPSGGRSFENKYLGFSTDYGSPSIDSMTWSWQESEVISGGYNENMLGLYGYGGSWSPLNISPDNSTHTLGLSGFAPDGVIGILEVPPPTCPLPIDTPGEYQLGQDASGAPNSASDFDPAFSACVVIASSDVVFDCNGFNITNYGVGSTIGIFLDGYSGPLTNVTIRNCPGISGYYFGLFAHGTSGSNFTNLTALANLGGLGLESSSNNAILNSAFNGGIFGAYLSGSSTNRISNSTFSGNGYSGVYLDSGSGNSLIGNTVSGNGNGIGTGGEQNDTIADNMVSGSGTGISVGTGPGPAPSYELYSDTYTTVNDPETHTFSYGVISDNSPVVLMISSGWEPMDSVSLPLGCTEQQFVTGPDNYETGYIATCTQDAGSYDVNVTSYSGTFLSFAAYVFPPGSYIDDMNAVTGTGNDLSIPLSLGDDLYLCAGGAGNGPLASVSGTIDAENPAVGSSGSGGSAAWHQSDYTCSETTNSPDLVLVGAAIVINGTGTPPLMNTISNNTIHNNDVGLSMTDSGTNTVLAHGHFYGNGQDMLLNESLGNTLVLNAAGMIFDNPSGGMSNYTNLTISDTLSSESYSINWSGQPPDTPPDNLSSFRQKFVNITPISGSPSIDSINWSWTNTETSGYDEPSFRLYQYDAGGWADTLASLDESTNTLSLSGLVPGSDYGILGNVTEAGNVSVALESPIDGYNATRRAITFNCSANASKGLYNITLYGNFTGSWQANRTNDAGGLSDSTEFTLNLSYAQYSWNCLAYDTEGNSAWAPANFTFTADSLPRASDFGGSTTDFNTELDLQNVSTPILENTTYGILQWNGSGLDVAGADFNSNVLFGRGWVSVDSSHLSSTLNSPANITLYGLPYQYMPIVYSDGALCTDCTILSYATHNLAFTVPHFTNYSAGPNTNLTIYDQYEGSNVSKLTNITFYANYTNATDGSHVAGATCTISFDDATSGTMVDTGTQYNYTKASGFSTTGIHLWNVTCNETGYETLFAQDDVDVGPLNLTGNMTSLYQATVNASVALPRFEYNGSGNLTSEGGNITGVDVGTEQLTDRWAAFYGNITGSIMLTDKAGANNVYQWGWTPASGGVVCTSTNSSVTDLMLYPADGDDIDAAWSFAPTEPDSGRNTFNQTGCSLTIGTTPITNAGYADTGQPGGFITCSLKDTTIAAKKDMYFCTNITQNGVFWNNQVGDFELMVPTTFGANQYETYYFYVNLD